MRLRWTKFGDIPHGFLCATPIHLIYRIRGAAPVGELRRLSENLKLGIKDLRAESPAGSAVLEKLLTEYARVYDDLLDAQDQRRFVLNDANAAKITLDSWHELRRRQELELYAACIMGNHVHVLLKGWDGMPDVPIGSVVGRHKTYTNHEIRLLIDHPTKIWDEGFFDRYVREGTFWKVLWYILQNPVKAGLVRTWRDWPSTYVDERCLAGIRERFE